MPTHQHNPGSFPPFSFLISAVEGTYANVKLPISLIRGYAPSIWVGPSPAKAEPTVSTSIWSSGLHSASLYRFADGFRVWSPERRWVHQCKLLPRNVLSMHITDSMMTNTG